MRGLRPAAPPAAADVPFVPLRSSTTIVDLAGTGAVYSYSILHHPQNPAFTYPVVAVLVELDEGVRVLSNLVDIDPRDVSHRYAGRGPLRADP